jgi:chemotaxis protein methyltransferase CheR
LNDFSSLNFNPASEINRITPRQFKALADMIRAEIGINIKDSKQTMLEGRLRRRVSAVDVGSIGEYCDMVIGGRLGPGEFEHLINAVTTNKTDFFREPAHFDYLMETVLPLYAAENCRQIRCWSAACSTGAEPYTLAMLLDRRTHPPHLLPQRPHLFRQADAGAGGFALVRATAARGVPVPRTFGIHRWLQP